MPSRAKPATRPMTLVPVTNMEEVPVLTAEERMSLTASLVAAEARISQGEFVEFDAAAFKERLIQSFRSATRAREK